MSPFEREESLSALESARQAIAAIRRARAHVHEPEAGQVLMVHQTGMERFERALEVLLTRNKSAAHAPTYGEIGREVKA